MVYIDLMDPAAPQRKYKILIKAANTFLLLGVEVQSPASAVFL